MQENNVAKGHWMCTVSGKQFWPLSPKSADIEIEDIAHALSMLCRFGGHIPKFYSVAQHSIYVSRLLPPKWRLAGLLHDAGEAYLGDVITPLKHSLPSYSQIEERVMMAVCRRFGLDAEDKEMWAAVHKADKSILKAEFRDIYKLAVDIDFSEFVTSEHSIKKLWRPAKAKRKFLDEFKQLRG